MKAGQWFQARLRWAVMEEGYGIQHWRESEHIFLSEDRESAFQEALRIGWQQEHALVGDDGSPDMDHRLAEVVYLDCLGVDKTACEVYLGEKEARERIGFDHIFEPAGQAPPPSF